MKPDRLTILVVVLLAVGAIWRTLYLRTTAREIAEEWLRRKGYKILQLSAPWFSFVYFAPKFLRDQRNSWRFRGIVEDRQLGGQGIVWLRVWTDQQGLLEREPDANWEIIPEVTNPTQFVPAELRLEMTQRALLERIARGETRFVAPRQEYAGEMPFDELVEHLLAMQNRGLITITPPQRARTQGLMYELVDRAELTDAGRAKLSAVR